MWEAVLDVINKQEPSTCLSLVLGYGAVSGCEYCATFYYFLLVFVNFPLPGCVWFAGFQGGSLSLFLGVLGYEVAFRGGLPAPLFAHSLRIVRVGPGACVCHSQILKLTEPTVSTPPC